MIGADGSLTGYAGGLDRKTRLLTLEGVLRRGPGRRPRAGNDEPVSPRTPRPATRR
ncbi:hypothetical protein DN402_07655 [Streptomyces sp. SW4]|nr:hypothetical protein DN402_07655 [Streptomyces sp. SW4]